MRLYYYFKPFLPWRLRMAMRRVHARRLRARTSAVWPILPGSEKPPAGWPGWPEGRQFAFVLTHDVEGPSGLAKVEALAEVERRHGFRSCYNFIPEGDYQVTPEMRQWLADDGFEVGVHDLYHNGKLYASERRFPQHARRINHYLRAWDAAGFRSGFMHHRLDWLHQLQIQYDTSTFDTDPFEPQPDGVGTIFPFWVPNPASPTPDPRSPTPGPRSGYVELPYTLAQDSTLFLLFGERTIDLWKHKVDWVARHGGLVLVNIHPDYVAMGGEPGDWKSFPLAFYEALLDYLNQRYAGAFWHATPRAVAEYVRQSRLKAWLDGAVSGPLEIKTPSRRIWIDLDNTPHVPFFEPIIKELRQRGHSILVTARDAFQVCELAEQKGIAYQKVGRHYGKNPVLKICGLFYRAAQLAPLVLKEHPVLAVSHGSRSQLILCNLLGIPSVLLADYEFAKYLPLMKPCWEMVPEVIPSAGLYCPETRILKYPGIKENVYVTGLQPDPSLLRVLGITENEILVTARPPATEAHYHNPESERLFERFMSRVCATNSARVVLLPRNRRQEHALRLRHPEWFAEHRTVVPASAVDGLNLLWHSDLVVSGGGTMNREAAALGVPVYSIFRGTIGAVDRHLEETGRLVLIRSPQDVDSRIRLERRKREAGVAVASSSALARIVSHLEYVLLVSQARPPISPLIGRLIKPFTSIIP